MEKYALVFRSPINTPSCGNEAFVQEGMQVLSDILTDDL